MRHCGSGVIRDPRVESPGDPALDGLIHDPRAAGLRRGQAHPHTLAGARWVLAAPQEVTSGGCSRTKPGLPLQLAKHMLAVISPADIRQLTHK
jgi:hypothetical protein